MKGLIQSQDLSEAMESQKAYVSEAKKLFEEKWIKKYPGIADMFGNPVKEVKAAQTIQMLENQQMHLSRLDEVTVVSKFGDIAPRVLDIMRLVYPNQVAHELVSVQVMKSITDVIYFVKPVYSGRTNAGGTPVGANQQAFTSSQQASEEVTDPVGTGDGTTVNFQATPSYNPLRPKTVIIMSNGAQVAQDDGNGNIVGTGVTGTVNYNGGANAIDITFATAPATGAAIEAFYLFDSEANTTAVGGIDIVFSTYQVKARAHKLKLKWSVDAAITAQSALGFDVEDVLSIAGAQEIKAQKDFSLTEDLRRVAGGLDANLTFNAVQSTQYYAEWQHAQGFRRTLAKSSNRILNTVGRGMSSWFVVGTDVAEYMTYLDGYVEEPNKVPIGVYRVGSYRGLPVYLDSRQATNEFLTGYIGNLFGDSGYVLAEFIELYATNTIELDDFQGRKGIASFYDKKVITPGYFKRGKISFS